MKGKVEKRTDEHRKLEKRGGTMLRPSDSSLRSVGDGAVI